MWARVWKREKANGGRLGLFFFVIIIINIIIIFLNIARFLIILLFMHAWLLSFELFVGMYRIPNMAGDQLWQVNTCGG
jgi:hypothetical protein